MGKRGRPAIFTEEEAQILAKLRGTGMSCDRIAVMYGCSGATVRNVTNPYGPFPRAAQARASSVRVPLREADPRVQDMVARRKRGETLEEIGRAYGLTRERIRQLTCGYYERPRVTREDVIAEVRALAEKLGRSPSSSEYGNERRAFVLFGGWKKTLEAAGLPPYVRSREDAQKRALATYAKYRGKTVRSSNEELL